jgi:nicotinamide-nucleotide amidase
MKGARSLPNPVGWAPVIVFDTTQTAVVAMPGPPREMRACFTEYLAKRIGERTRYRSVARRVIVTMYESQVSLLIDELVDTIPGVYFKPLVADYQREKGLPVDVIVFAEDEKICNEKTEEAIRRLRELVKKKGASLACSD